MFEQLIARLAQELVRVGIPYMVIGGQAVQLYGEPRMTKDIDLTLGIGLDGLSRVLDLCNSLGLKVLVANPEEFVRETMVLPALEQKTGIRVDFVLSFSDYERQAIERSRKVKLGGTAVSFASLEDLVVHKLVAGRPRDIEDVRIMLAKNPGFDRSYVQRWLGELDRALDQNLSPTLARILKDLPDN